MAQSRSGGSLPVWRAMVLIGAAGTAAGLIGKLPWLGLVAGPLSIIGVVGLLVAQRTARVRPGREKSRARPGAAGAARRWPARVWVGAGAAVAVAIGAAALLAHPWSRDDHLAKPGAARTPLSLYMVRDVLPGPCEPGLPDSTTRYTSADGSECVRVSADGGLTARQLEQVRVDDDSAQGNGWTVTVTFGSEDAARFTDLSGRLSVLPRPRNQLAVVLGSRMLSDPMIEDRLTAGTATIATRLTRDEAQAVAGELGAR
ncbi:hypothetical protein ACTOB_007055 [Actinoplanes oblitus]|uniref:SecDF P1 head subdomain domain-containing protein n=1 Tax=Actinoplanes oblitus TaxID=3040509 RepID=A0ABY8WF53_9ACTN|nr:hypothetical protein [Actinoplanes oblitus]WIM94994.1 hypothetical protein ACTOB_007055 [Actinoplanes oblitus]